MKSCKNVGRCYFTKHKISSFKIKLLCRTFSRIILVKAMIFFHIVYRCVQGVKVTGPGYNETGCSFLETGRVNLKLHVARSNLTINFRHYTATVQCCVVKDTRFSVKAP